MEFLPAIFAVLILGGALVYVVRGRERDADAYLRALNLAIESGRKEREELVTELRRLSSEMATRVQHPEIVRPELTAVPEPDEPPEPEDAFVRAGRIFPADPNGDTPDGAA